MEVPSNLKYTADHEWISLDGEIATIGITDYAQDALGDVVFVQLPAVGDSVSATSSISEVESTKSVSDIYAPLSGEVLEVNVSLESSPEILNSDPYGAGWIFKIKFSNPAELGSLLSPEQYQALMEH